jgi:hypothetical protein
VALLTVLLADRLLLRLVARGASALLAALSALLAAADGAAARPTLLARGLSLRLSAPARRLSTLLSRWLLALSLTVAWLVRIVPRLA